MLDRLIDFAVHRRALVMVATAAFAIFGVLTLSKLKVESFPDVTNVQVMVISLYSGQAAEEVERQVTLPVERALVGVPNVLIQRSITSFGLSQVILTFEDGVDIYFARQQVAERLPEAEVAQGVEPHLGPNDTPVGQIFQYTLESDHHDPKLPLVSSEARPAPASGSHSSPERPLANPPLLEQAAAASDTDSTTHDRDRTHRRTRGMLHRILRRCEPFAARERPAGPVRQLDDAAMMPCGPTRVRLMAQSST
jgi:hypothetical protein